MSLRSNLGVIIGVMLLAPCASTQQTQTLRSQLEPAPWAQSAVDLLREVGIIEGYSVFHGSAPMTRYETAVAIVRFLERMDPQFKQVQSDAPVEFLLEQFAPAVARERRFLFRGRQPTTRAELAVIVSRLIRRVERKEPLNFRKAFFKDVTGGEWSFGAVLVAVGTGVMQGYPNHTFRGNQPVTHNEFAVVLARLVELSQ